jgi:hypothetical protein
MFGLNGGLYCAQSVPPPTLLDFFTGILMTAVISTPVWYYLRNRLQTYYPQTDEMEDEDSSEEDDDAADDDDANNANDANKEDYSMHYMTEFVLLDKRPLTEDDLEHLQKKMVTETTDFGDIIMTYHRPTEAFWYYTDHLKEVSYTLLEAVARKFMVENNCGGLSPSAKHNCGGLSPSAKHNCGGLSPPASPIKAEDSLLSVAQEGLAGGQNPFAKFKKYNTGSNSANANSANANSANANSNSANANSANANSANHFRYKGKLYEHADLQMKKSQEDAVASVPTMTYAAFKQLMEEKKSN